MRVVTAPDTVETIVRPSIFLAGAITGAADWQEAASGLLGSTFATCFNPRRPDGFVSSDHPEYVQRYKEQVRWEHTYLLAADVVLFWLPQNALAITTRFELGWLFGLKTSRDNRISGQHVVVGIEPGVLGDMYYRIVLPSNGIAVHATLAATCQAAISCIMPDSSATRSVEPDMH